MSKNLLNCIFSDKKTNLMAFVFENYITNIFRDVYIFSVEVHIFNLKKVIIYKQNQEANTTLPND